MPVRNPLKPEGDGKFPSPSFFTTKNEVEIARPYNINNMGFIAMTETRIALRLSLIQPITFAVFLLLALWIPESATAAQPFIAFEFDVDENRIDGCTNCGCQLKGELTPNTPQEWWFSFGLVKPDDDQTWQAIGSPSHCSPGAFREIEQAFKSTVGTPFIILQLKTQTKLNSSTEVKLEVELDYTQFTEFNKNGEAKFTHTRQERTFMVGDGTRVTVPVLIPKSDEADAFQVNEVLLNLWAAELAASAPVSYGTLAVSADVPGAVVLLDGGNVGWIQEGRPLLIANVLTGKREIRLRDFSGREVAKSVKVKEGRTSELKLDILNLDKKEHSDGLVSLGKNPQGYQEFWRLADRAMMVEIPAGAFLMGSPEGQGEPDERPQHEVTLSGFLIDKTEVTWRQYQIYASANNKRLPPGPVWGIFENYPISFILPREAEAFCRWAGGRLPTEAEWEKAARGIDGRNYPWGDKWDATRCNSISGGMHRPEAVGAFPSCISPYGALDMAGSMWEWTSGHYAAYSPDGSDNGKNRDENAARSLQTMRGGAWMNQSGWLRTAYRHERSPRSRNMDHGFRCVMDQEVSE